MSRSTGFTVTAVGRTDATAKLLLMLSLEGDGVNRAGAIDAMSRGSLVTGLPIGVRVEGLSWTFIELVVQDVWDIFISSIASA